MRLVGLECLATIHWDSRTTGMIVGRASLLAAAIQPTMSPWLVGPHTPPQDTPYVNIPDTYIPSSFDIVCSGYFRPRPSARATPVLLRPPTSLAVKNLSKLFTRHRAVRLLSAVPKRYGQRHTGSDSK